MGLIAFVLIIGYLIFVICMPFYMDNTSKFKGKEKIKRTLYIIACSIVYPLIIPLFFIIWNICIKATPLYLSDLMFSYILYAVPVVILGTILEVIHLFKSDLFPKIGLSISGTYGKLATKVGDTFDRLATNVDDTFDRLAEKIHEKQKSKETKVK